jgi:hypothetical protein
MTRQHLVGELSLILGELHEAAPNDAAADDVIRLRHEAELASPAALASLAVRAMELTDGLCWDALSGGRTDEFAREAAICAELWEYGVCAGLLEDPAVRS